MSNVLLVNANLKNPLPLKSNSVHMCGTSPPYWGRIRDYGINDQFGFEPTIEEYIESMMNNVFDEVWRVLRNDGIFFFNIGDVYWTGSKYSGRYDAVNGILRSSKNVEEYKPKNTIIHSSDYLKKQDLCGIPWRLAIAAQQRGWYVRNANIWVKGISFLKQWRGQVMPEPTETRFVKSHEFVFMFTKTTNYFFDPYNIDEKLDQRNAFPRDCWHIKSNKKKNGSHIAEFPESLPRIWILGATSEYGVCPECGAQYKRVYEYEKTNRNKLDCGNIGDDGVTRTTKGLSDLVKHGKRKKTFIGWYPTCEHKRYKKNEVKRPIVLETFCGSGTTPYVAKVLGRYCIALDLNFGYLKNEAKSRIGDNINKNKNYNTLPIFGGIK